MSILSNPIFHDEHAAYAYMESILWPDGPVCPKCGVVDNAFELKGKRARPGLRRCKDCKKDFTVKVGTVFESSHVSMCDWLQAAYLLSASKKGFSAHQLHRTLGVTYKTAWFMFHRLREAMRVGDLPPMGGEGKTVESDETFIGKKYDKPKGARGYAHKEAIPEPRGARWEGPLEACSGCQCRDLEADPHGANPRGHDANDGRSWTIWPDR